MVNAHNFHLKNRNCIYILSICIIFYLYNYFTPLYSDDWHYNFIFGTLEPVTSVGDIIRSQWLHYNGFNGRFTPHFFIQLFDGILGKGLFNIVNTSFFFFFLYLMAYVTQSSKQLNNSICVITFTLFLFVPGFKNNFLWMSGACNYLWVAVFILIFHVLLTKNITNKKYYPLAFIYGLFTGWTNEAFIVGLACGYFVYYIFHRKELTTYRIFLLSGFFLGSVLLVFAPGSIHRAIGDSTYVFEFEKVVNKMIYSLKAMSNLRIFIIFFLLFIISKIAKLVDIRTFIFANQIWLIAMSISFIFVWLTGHDSVHSRFGIEFFALILILKLVSLYSIPKFFIFLGNTVTLLLSLYILHFAHLNYIDYRNCINQMQNTKQEIILNNPVQCNSYVNRFIVQVPDPDFSFINNECIANHFGKRRILFIPELLYNEIVQNPQLHSSFDLDSPYPFYVKKITKGQDVKSVLFELIRKTSLKNIHNSTQTFTNDLIPRKSEFIQADLFSIIGINNNYYLFVRKINTYGGKVNNILIKY